MRTKVAAAGSTAFFLVAPGTAVGVLPWLLTGWRVAWPAAYWSPVAVLGGVLLAGGLAGLIHTFVRFVVEGSGTPAPIAPTDRLVVGGLYRHVRNPMYVAILATIIGQALVLCQPVLLGYAAVGWFVCAIWIRWYEEPTLHRQFGAQYEVYRQAVPAWLPRLRPWRADQAKRDGKR